MAIDFAISPDFWIPYIAVSSSIILPLVYVWFFKSFETDEESPSPTIGFKNLRFEYRALDSSVRQRENSLVSTGAIFVAASLILLGQSAVVSTGSTDRASIVFGSWLIYSVWLFVFQLTTVKLTKATFNRLNWLEHRLGFEVHRYLRDYRGPIRRWLWFDGLCALLITGNPLLGLTWVSTIPFLWMLGYQAWFYLNDSRKQ